LSKYPPAKPGALRLEPLKAAIWGRLPAPVAVSRLNGCTKSPANKGFRQSKNSPVSGDCVVELVGLEPTTRRLWAAAMSDQLTLSNTRHSKLEDFRY